MKLIRIVTPYFVAGLEYSVNGNRCAPIIKYMKNWNIKRIVKYCEDKSWRIEII